MKEGLFVVGAGAVTSVGYSLPATTAAIAAGIDSFADTQFVDDRGEPVIGARIPAPENQNSSMITGGATRAAKHIAWAIEEAIDDAGHPAMVNPQLVVLTPTAATPTSNRIADRILAACTELLGFDLFEQRVRTLREGTTGICDALMMASQYFNEIKAETAIEVEGDLEAFDDVEDYGDSEACSHIVIVAFDSWLNVTSISRGLAANRLQVSEVVDGFIPGEAASAIVVSASQPEETQSLRIAGVGIALEEAHFDAEESCTGVGLSTAMKMALDSAAIETHQTNLRIANLTGEEYFFDESAFAWGRVLRKHLPPTYRLEVPASVLGEVGTAFGPLAIGYTLSLAKSGRSAGPNAMIQLSTSSEKRGVVIGIIE